MAENKMREVAKLLGVEMGVPFKIKNLLNKFMIDKYGLYSLRTHNHNESILVDLLCGNYEIEQPILDEVEKRYLESVLRPFKDRVNYVSKYEASGDELILINYDVLETRGYYATEVFVFPEFEKDTMYKGMELEKEYTLEELGLFQD